MIRALRLWLYSAVSGAVAGVSSYVFLEVLDSITDFRLDHDALIWALPIVGALIGFAYSRCDPRTQHGNATMLAAVRGDAVDVPLQLAPMTLFGTWLTHLVGGSGGREGTAMQLSGALTDTMSRVARCDRAERRVLLHAATAGAFGSVFGVPYAGVVFAMEEPGRKGSGARALIPSIIAAFVGHAVVSGLGYRHGEFRALHPHFSAKVAVATTVAAVLFGITAGVYVRVTNIVRRLSRWMRFPTLATATGGLWILVLALVFGREYLGLSLPLGADALRGVEVGFSVFALKLVFTAVTSGSGFRAGEVTPLFVIGATLGAALSTPLGVDTRLLAALGFMAVFGAAAKTPFACAVMGIELFGWNAAGLFVLVCFVARLASGRKGIYPRH